ncbi:hypothetical protein H4R35_003172 [Dimargaris xerosporica]|nr:hypothetical protein H4R35_003172 [Dimargaris xerosporica]
MLHWNTKQRSPPPDFRWYRYRDYFEAKRKPFSSRKIYQALLADPRRYHIHSYKQSNPVHQRVLRHLKIHDPFDTDDYEPDNTAVGSGFFGHGQQLIYDEPESYV